MPAPKKIPPVLEPDLLRMTGEGKVAKDLVAWLEREHGVKVTTRAVQLHLAKVAKVRAPITKAIVVDRLQKTVTKDLDAIDGLLVRAEKHETNAGKLDDIKQELERLAKVDIKDVIDEKTGRLKDLHLMPEDARRAIASIEVEELFEGQGENREKVGDLVKVRFWDKLKGLELAAKIRSGHMALQAMESQKRLLELRFRLSGAGSGGGGGDDEGGVVLLPPEGD